MLRNLLWIESIGKLAKKLWLNYLKKQKNYDPTQNLEPSIYPENLKIMVCTIKANEIKSHRKFILNLQLVIGRQITLNLEFTYLCKNAKILICI